MKNKFLLTLLALFIVNLASSKNIEFDDPGDYERLNSSIKTDSDISFSSKTYDLLENYDSAFTLVDNLNNTANLQIIHNSADPTAEFVDIYLDGTLIVDNFEFRTATTFLSVPAGTPINIDVAPSTSSNVSESIYNLNTTLTDGETYIAVANGVLDPTQFDDTVNTINFGIDVFSGAQQVSTNPGEISVLVHHGSTDAPTVDIRETNAPAGIIVNDISYTEFQGYLNLSNLNYVLNVELGNNSGVIQSYEASLQSLGLADSAITVIASGFLDPASNQSGSEFGLWVALPSGGSLLQLPVIPPPSNDDLCGALPVTVGGLSFGNSYTTIGATAEPNEPIPNCFNNGIDGSVWFTFEAPLSGEVTVTTDIENSTLIDSEIAVYEAPTDCSDLSTLGSILGCDQDGGDSVNFNSVLDLTGLTSGETYYIQVDKWGSALPGTFGLRVLDANPQCPEPSNLEVSNITETTAVLEWDDVSQATAGFEWFVVESGDNPEVDTPVDNGSVGAGVTTATATGLTGETAYDYYIKSDCNPNGESIFAGPITFTSGIIPVVVSDGNPAFDNYCYDNDDFKEWRFDSDDGSPLVMIFSAGSVEAGFDDLIIYDGTDDTGAILFDSDNDGNEFAGLSFTATSGSIYVTLDADGSVSCQSSANIDTIDFGVYVLGDEPEASVQIIHNSADPSAEFVDVYLDGTKVVPNFEFRTATVFLDVPAVVTIDIDIAPSGSNDVSESIFNLNTSLAADETYIAVANGVLDTALFDASVNTIDFGIDVFASAQQASTNPGGVSVLVHHGSTDAPTVDVVETLVGAGMIVDDISYTEFQGYLDLVVQDYEINVELADNSAVVAAYEAPLQTLNLVDSAITVLASGFLDPTNNQSGPAFGLWVASSAGGALIPLPEKTVGTESFDSQNFSFYPNPAENRLNLQTAGQVEEVRILNMLGQEVMKETPNTVSPSLNVEALQVGTYIMNVTIDGTSANFRFIKE